VLVNVGSQAAPLYNRITDLSVTPGHIEMKLSSVPGKTARLERTVDMISWTLADSARVPPDSTVNLKDQNPPATNAYYRVNIQ